jgi:hypothetical protein
MYQRIKNAIIIHMNAERTQLAIAIMLREYMSETNQQIGFAEKIHEHVSESTGIST